MGGLPDLTGLEFVGPELGYFMEFDLIIHSYNLSKSTNASTPSSASNTG